MSEGVHTQQSAEQPTLNIWDFAGQDLYYTTHQTFLSSRAIYLVVFNLCHDLDEPMPVQDQVRCKDGSGGSITSYRTTPIQYLDFWMQSIFTYTKENSSQDVQKSPPIFIVGTNRNSVGGDDLPDNERKALIDEIFTRIRLEIHDKPYNRYVVSEFYAVENSLEDNVKIEKLRNHIESIAMKEPYMKERIPLNWLTFDDEKANISGGKPVMTLKQVMDGFEIEDETELLTMLKFYHDLGHIIYFGGDGESQALKDVVILKPQWLIDAFKKILTVKHPRKQSKEYANSWGRLKNNGILDDSLIDHMWQDIFEHKTALLDLMDMFDLLCERLDKPSEEEHGSPVSSTAAAQHAQPCSANASYYVPSMLQRRTSSLQHETVENKNTSVFFVDFKGFLPDGLYHRLVVRALRWSQTFGGKDLDPGLLYDRANVFVHHDHEFVLQMVHRKDLAYIKVSVARLIVIPAPQNVKPPSTDVTCEVKDFVEEHLQSLKTTWIKRIKYCISVQCPNKLEEPHFLPLDDCLKKPEFLCRFKHCRALIKTEEIQAMFKQESSEEEASARADRQPMSDILFKEIAKDFGKERGEDLAKELGVESEEVDTNKKDYNTSGVNEQIFQILSQWRETRGNEVDKMRKELIDALMTVGKFGLAHKVQTEY
ncbi:probable serine/threonine-protein kinase pats1 [Patiria miniata]|uniref:Death domain-containing protein n=1 Tax=Patiria miniata TaxID=46514 RepID=A0A914ABJ1_PATMI|nr:probable serine/threonine-protein kinase pats1 [Patiria miniata]